MKRIALLLTIWSLSVTVARAQERPLHIKTNLPLWVLSVPNLCIEYQFAPKQSVSVGGHLGDFVFISEMAIQGVNIHYRKYFNRKSDDLKGFYLSPGVAYYAERYNDRFPPTYGVRTDIGLQHVFKSNIIIDAGAGLYWQLYEENVLEGENNFYVQPLLRANISIGYRF